MTEWIADPQLNVDVSSCFTRLIFPFHAALYMYTYYSENAET